MPSELSENIIKIIDDVRVSQEDYGEAFKLLSAVESLPPQKVVERASRIITACRENEKVRAAVGDRVSHAMWMLTEANIQTGNEVEMGAKFDEMLAGLFGGKR